MEFSGKRWRCSKEILHSDEKYCESHVHRGKNKSVSQNSAQAQTSSLQEPTSAVSTLQVSEGIFVNAKSTSYLRSISRTVPVSIHVSVWTTNNPHGEIIVEFVLS